MKYKIQNRNFETFLSTHLTLGDLVTLGDLGDCCFLLDLLDLLLGSLGLACMWMILSNTEHLPEVLSHL